MTNYKVSIGALAFTALLGCSQVNGMDEFEGDDVEAVSEQELSALLAPEPKSRYTDYRAYSKAYRLFGVSGEGTSRYATLANKKGWATFDVRVGDMLGRNWKVAEIGDTYVRLSGPSGSVRLNEGRDASVREILHRIDRVTTYLGKHRHIVNASAAKIIRERYGVGATSEGRSGVFPDDAVELVTVDPKGLFGRLGFQAGDLVFTVENSRMMATQSALESLADKFQNRDLGMITVRVFRGGSSQDLQFEIR